jgi:hypothetical protein
MNRSTISRNAVASVLLAAAGVGMAVVPAAAQDGTGVVTGAVWFDRDADRAIDADEPGRADAVVELYHEHTLVATTRTDAAGGYSFTGLTPGDYTVANTSTAGYSSTTQPILPVAVGAGTLQVNFGLQGGRIAGTTWRDDNGDGVRQATDNPKAMSGVEVRLEATDFPRAYATIDAQGNFAFEDLPNLADFRLWAPPDTVDEFTIKGADSVVDHLTGLSDPIAVGNGETLTVGIGYREAGVDLSVAELTVPKAKVGKEFTVVATIANNSNSHDEFGVQLRALPKGMKVVATTGMKRVRSNEPRLFDAVSDTFLIGGGSTRISLTVVADRPVNTPFQLSVAPRDLRDWNPADNTVEGTWVVTAGDAGTGTPGAVHPVVNKKTPAHQAPAKQSVEVKDLASTGASPMIPLILSSVLLAAGGALLFVLRRRVSRR